MTLIEVRIGYAIGGKGFVTLTGDVGAVREAVAAASRDAELLVGTSFLVIQTIVNTFGVTASGRRGRGGKGGACSSMLVPSAICTPCPPL